MKDNSNISEENYSKDVGIGTFILEWIPILIMGTLFFTCFCIAGKIVIDIVFGVLFHRDFSIIDYLINGRIFADLDAPLFIAFLFLFVFSLYGWRLYYLIGKKPFASITDEKLILSFEREIFLWNQVRAVHLEDNRKLTIILEKKGKHKKNAVDLRWFPQKEDFIQSLRDICTKEDIPFYESELTYFSRIWLRMGFGL